jgi:hypothetical protein
VVEVEDGEVRILLPVGAAWLAVLALGPAAMAEPMDGAEQVDDIARLMAGLSTEDSALARFEQRRSWVEYGQAIDGRWQKLEARQLAPMRAWSARKLAGDPGREVFYPFSGPDLVNPMTILRDRKAYVLLSLEPVGLLPDFAAFDEPSFDAFFAGMRQSLSSALKWDFFQTKELRRDLAVPGLEGVLPLLLFFAARDGQQVLGVQYLFVRPDGTLHEVAARPGEAPAGEGVPGVRITLRSPGSEAVRFVDYFSVDLSSHSLDTRQGFFSFVSRRGPFTTYLKAASYLMFKPKYAAIQRFVLDHSRQVLQDDSGVPFAELQRRGWNLQLYGSYERPIRLFAHRYQEDLAEAYRTRTDVSPLPFATGYKIRADESTLMLATRPGG